VESCPRSPRQRDVGCPPAEVACRLADRQQGRDVSLSDRVGRAERLPAILAAVYAAYGPEGCVEPEPGGSGVAAGLPLEAIRLARLVADVLPDEPEPAGLLALMLHREARRSATRAGGRFVPLNEQDVSAWDRRSLYEAERTLARAARLTGVDRSRVGRYQLEAAIQSAHSAPAFGFPVDRSAVVLLYDRLLAAAPSAGAAVARAAALAAAGDAEAGLDALDRFATDAGDRLAAFRPYHVVRAELSAQTGNPVVAAAAFRLAAGLSVDRAVRTHLLTRAAECEHA
ncbi:MAG: DUF6596 domain-containing protein, partial [Planctomycetota bacterium]